ncbi:MAG TPA: hypothetical protein PKD18_06055, partial [Saprospiraceae bacterium]|nr:hypothetical protein [Saprospiraceae bacterium]
MMRNAFLLVFGICGLVLLNGSCKNATVEQVSTDTAEFKFLEYDINQMQAGYANGDFTIEQVVDAYLKRIAEIDQQGPALHSVIEVNPEALAIAAALDVE